MTIQSEIQALKCADCARSDSAVSDLQPDSLLPIPADALSGWRDGQPGLGRRDAPQAAAQRRARLRGRVRRDPALVRGGLGVGRRAGGRADAEEHRRRSTSTAATTASTASCRRARPSTPSTSRCGPRSPACSGDGTGAAVGTTIMPNTGGTLGVREQARVRHRRRSQRRHQGLRHALRRRHRRRRLGSRDHPGGRLQPAQPLALREPRLLVRRCALAAADRLARPLARHLRLARRTRCRRSRSTPACPSRSARSKAPVCALEGLQGVGFGVPGVDRRRQRRGRQAGRRAVRAPATTRSPARAA